MTTFFRFWLTINNNRQSENKIERAKEIKQEYFYMHILLKKWECHKWMQSDEWKHGSIILIQFMQLWIMSVWFSYDNSKELSS